MCVWVCVRVCSAHPHCTHTCAVLAHSMLTSRRCDGMLLLCAMHIKLCARKKRKKHTWRPHAGTRAHCALPLHAQCVEEASATHTDRTFGRQTEGKASGASAEHAAWYAHERRHTFPHSPLLSQSNNKIKGVSERQGLAQVRTGSVGFRITESE